MDAVARRMMEVKWSFADKDANALDTLAQRIADAGRREDVVTYSDLVRGLEFHLPTVQNGIPYRIDVHDWSGLDRSIIGEFLGYLSMQTYIEHGFMASGLCTISPASPRNVVASANCYRNILGQNRLIVQSLASALVLVFFECFAMLKAWFHEFMFVLTVSSLRGLLDTGSAVPVAAAYAANLAKRLGRPKAKAAP